MTKLLNLGAIALALGAVSAPATAERLVGLTAANTVVTFDSSTPGTILNTRIITGLASGDVLTGIDLRPANRTLYSVATNGRLYALTATGATYTAQFVGTVAAFAGARYGIDFNPVADRLRFVTDNDNNLRINPANGATVTDGTIVAPGAEALVGAAYTNSRVGVTATALYALDASGNQLLRSTNPNAGTYEEIGTLGGGVDFGALNNVGFDISGQSGIAYFNNGASLYTINLTSAATTLLGTIGSGSLVGLSVAVPEPAGWALMIVGMGLTGVALRRRRTPVELAA